MAILKVEYDSKDFEFMAKLRKIFPTLRARTMGYVGARGKEILRREFLSGQAINLSVYPRDKIGRRTVSYNVGKHASQVSIASYPMNLFERGRMLRSGKKEPGKHVITRKLKQAMMSNMQQILNEADKKILETEIRMSVDKG